MNRTNLPLETLFPKLMRMAAAKTKDDSDAEDLVNDTFLAVLHAMAKGKEIENTEAYAVRTLNNLFYGRLREKYNTPIMSVHEDIFAGLSSDEPNIEEALISREEEEDLRRAVAYLAKNYREAIVRFYLHGESAEMIAQSLSVPQGTVKSRLDTGRKTLRKELTMKNYDTQSYEPKKMVLSLNGSTGRDGSPFSTLPSSDLLGQNILICAYEKPLTAVEIAKTLGVASYYVEAQIEKFVHAELMKKTKDGKYGTDFLIISAEKTEMLLEKQEAFAKAHYNAVFPILSDSFKKLLTKPYIANKSEQVKRSILATFGIEAMTRMLKAAEKSFCKAPDYNDYPERPYGGRWWALGDIRGGNEEKQQMYFISGTLSSDISWNGKKIYLFDHSSEFGRTHQVYRFNATEILTLLVRIYHGKTTDIASEDLTEIPHLKALGILETADSDTRIAVPYFTKEEMNDFRALLLETHEKISKTIGEDTKVFLKENLVETPAHVEGIHESSRYYHSYRHLPMLFLLEAEKCGVFPISLRGDDGKLRAPALLLCEA